MALPHIDYHAVLSSFREHRDGCPLCRAVSSAERSFWDSVLYGQVGTEGFQDAFLSTDGFCPRHVASFAAHRDGVAVTMLYSPLFTHRLKWINESEVRWFSVFARALRALRALRGRGAVLGVCRSRRPPAEQGRHAARHHCMLCQRIAVWTDQFLQNLLRYQSVSELQAAVESGDGLCLPHYRRLAELAGRGLLKPSPVIAPWLRDHHRRRWEDVVSQAEQEVKGRGGTAWKSLLRMMEGDDAV